MLKIIKSVLGTKRFPLKIPGLSLSCRGKGLPEGHGGGRGRDLFMVAFLFSLKFRLEELQGKQKSNTKGSHWSDHDLFRCQTLPKIVSSILYYCRL